MMKRAISSINLVPAIIFLSFTLTAVLAAVPPNFSGKWALDKAKSSNLPNIFETVDDYFLIIKQPDEKSISVATEFHGRGQTITSEPDTFPTDGNAVEKEDRRGFKIKRSFRFGEGQKMLVETEKHFTGDVRLPDTNESESWEITDGGKTLTITISPKDNNGTKQVRVFTKKE